MLSFIDVARVLCFSSSSTFFSLCFFLHFGTNWCWIKMTEKKSWIACIAPLCVIERHSKHITWKWVFISLPRNKELNWIIASIYIWASEYMTIPTTTTTAATISNTNLVSTKLEASPMYELWLSARAHYNEITAILRIFIEWCICETHHVVVLA